MTRFVLPPLDESWRALPLGKLAAIKYGSALPASSRATDGIVPVYGSGAKVGIHDTYLHNERSIVIGRKGSVGSIVLTDGPFWCIDTAYYLDELSGAVDLDYLAIYLESLDLSRLAISVAIPGLNRKELAAVPIPLPTLPEQQRIVDVLQEASKLRQLKTKALRQAEELSGALFEQHFGVAGATTAWPMETFGKHTTYSKYGPRFPDQQYSEMGVHVLRTTDMNNNGTIRWWEAPKLALTDAQIAEHALKPSTLVLSRSGTIGPVALFDGPEGRCVAGAYLLEFGIADTLDPEYARALFMTPYMQRMLKKAVRSVAQPNINAPNVKAILIPVPPIELQKMFANHVKEVRSWVKSVSDSTAQSDALVKAITGEAFLGELTEEWREQHRTELEAAACERDALLRERGTKLSVRITETVPPKRLTDFSRPARRWLVDELSEFQFEVWSMLRQEWCGSAIVDDPEVFGDFCTNPQTAWRIEHFKVSPNRIRRALEQLAALGLIAKVSLPKANAVTQQTEYMIAYRPLREDENTRLADVNFMRRELRIDKPEGAS